MKDFEKAAFRAAISKYGSAMQMVVAIEEMAELQKEVCKTLRGIGNPQHMAEEMADAGIMLDQLSIMEANADAVRSWRTRKVKRLQARVRGNG